MMMIHSGLKLPKLGITSHKFHCLGLVAKNVGHRIEHRGEDQLVTLVVRVAGGFLGQPQIDLLSHLSGTSILVHNKVAISYL